jgi:hypothetical protein
MRPTEPHQIQSWRMSYYKQFDILRFALAVGVSAFSYKAVVRMTRRRHQWGQGTLVYRESRLCARCTMQLLNGSHHSDGKASTQSTIKSSYER